MSRWWDAVSYQEVENVMRTARLLATLILLTLMTASLTAAGHPAEPETPPRPLFALGEAMPLQSQPPLLPNAAEEFAVQLEPAAVAANPESFRLDLPGHGAMEAVRTRFVDYQADWKSWLGDLRYADNGSPAGSIHIGFHGDRITALVELKDGERFRIAGGPGEGQRLIRLDAALTPASCGMSNPAEAAEPPRRRQRERSGKLRHATENILSCTANARIDVLVVYPARGSAANPGFFQLSEADEMALVEFVHDSITQASQVFTNNGINATYNLVGIAPLIHQDNPNEPALPASGLTETLNWMNDQRTELTNLRNAFGADVVVTFIPFSWVNPAVGEDTRCGLANLPFKSGNIRGRSGFEAYNNRAFSSQRVGCGLDDLTLAHEIGHTYGMQHDDETAVDTFRYPYARGYVFTGQYGQMATVMGCVCHGNCPAEGGPVCNRIPYFSDPQKSYAGVPIGTTEANNNALVACKEVANHAAMKAAVTNTEPTVAITTASCSGLTCSFRAGVNDNAAIPTYNYYWDFGDGSPIKRSTRMEAHTYASAGPHRVHVVVKDAGGQTGVGATTVNPWVAAYEGGHEASNCGTFYGWAWDQSFPNSPIDVDVYRDGGKVGSTTANLFGQDLYNAGKGNGYHRFNYTPNSGWYDGQWHHATVRFGGTNTDLAGTGQWVVCNAEIFDGLPPQENLSTGGQVYTVGTQLSSNVSGYIVELGFHRASGETGSNTLRLWSDTGVELANVTPYCTSSGWCWGAINPVYITAGTRYRVTVNTNTYQSKTGCGLGSGYTSDPLTAHSGYWAAGITFPNNGSCSNYFVDVKFNL